MTIIIPTTCERARWAGLERAITSLLSQQQCAVKVLVLVNGSRFAPDLLDALKARADIGVHYEQTGSLPWALHVGRRLVTTPFFGFLDDDDEYLPGAVHRRLAPMLADSSVAFVASNGFRQRVDGSDEAMLSRVGELARDPLAAMLQQNWLASCGGLYRSAEVSADDFDPTVKYYEWTYLAYRLASTRRVAFVAEPTFRIYSSPDSLSKSSAYVAARVDVIQKLLLLRLAPEIRRGLSSQLASAHHDVAELAWKMGFKSQSWRSHVRSLGCRHGWRYLSFTRHLLGKVF